MIARPSRASRERLSRLSSACWRCTLTHSAIALFMTSARAFEGRLLQMSLVTLPEVIVKGSSLPTFRAWAAIR